MGCVWEKTGAHAACMHGALNVRRSQQHSTSFSNRAQKQLTEACCVLRCCNRLCSWTDRAGTMVTKAPSGGVWVGRWGAGRAAARLQELPVPPSHQRLHAAGRRLSQGVDPMHARELRCCGGRGRGRGRDAVDAAAVPALRTPLPAVLLCLGCPTAVLLRLAASLLHCRTVSLLSLACCLPAACPCVLMVLLCAPAASLPDCCAPAAFMLYYYAPLPLCLNPAAALPPLDRRLTAQMDAGDGTSAA
eukprot:257138-Chlamydomonas_euryale.AAC.6